MILFKLSYPPTDDQIHHFQGLFCQFIAQLVKVHSQFDTWQPLVVRLEALVNLVGLSRTQWQTLQILINLRPLNFIVITLLAEFNSRCGYFSVNLRRRPKHTVISSQFEIAEIINLQEVGEETISEIMYNGMSGNGRIVCYYL